MLYDSVLLSASETVPEFTFNVFVFAVKVFELNFKVPLLRVVFAEVTLPLIVVVSAPFIFIL